MAIEPIYKRAETRKITTWDLEWTPTDIGVSFEADGTVTDNRINMGANLRMCGVYDEKGYRIYRTIEEFCDGEFIPPNQGRWYYAHAGGLADVQFLLDHFIKSGRYRVEASFSGSSAIMVNVRLGTMVWHLLDSFWLLRDSLERIGKAIGIKKLNDYKCANFPHCGHVDRKSGKEKCIYYAPDGILKTYNEQDCLILWSAITEFESTILDLGGQLQKTIASTAMTLFLRKYLTSPIETESWVNEVSRQAYTSSRVEPFQATCKEANYYDINSSFPYSMTKPHPGAVMGRGQRLPSRDGDIYIADCEIIVPDMYLPPLPYRNQWGRVYFPTGKWRRWLSSVDVELALKRGCKITAVHDVVQFEPRTDLAAYAFDIYERRLQAKQRGSEFESTVYKYLLNSLYGKFAEDKTKTALWIRPDKTSCPHHPPHPNNSCIQVLQPGVILITEECDIAHEWVPISVHITALSRAALEGYLYECRDDVYYCDTDSIVTTHTLPTGDKLGDLKLEMQVENGVFVAPKLYMIRDKEKQKDIVKAKGFSKLTVSEFQSLRDGIEVGIESMMRIRELLKRGLTTPHEKVFGKAYRGTTRPKRCLQEKNSRPWSCAEVEQKYTKKTMKK